MKIKLLSPTLALASSMVFNSCAVQTTKKFLSQTFYTKNIDSTNWNNVDWIEYEEELGKALRKTFEVMMQEKENERISKIFDNMNKEKKDIILNLLKQWIYENPEEIDDLTLSKIIISYKEIENPVEDTVNVDWTEYEVNLVKYININDEENIDKLYIRKKINENLIKSCMIPEPSIPSNHKN